MIDYETIQQIIIYLFVFLTAFSIGYAVSIREILQVFRRPRLVVAAILLNVVIIPLGVMGLGRYLLQSSAIPSGWVNLEAMVALVLINLLAGSAVALSWGKEKALVALTTVATALLMPLSLVIMMKGVGISEFVVDELKLIVYFGLWLLVPLAFGFWTREMTPKLAALWQPRIRVLTYGLMVAVIGLMIFDQAAVWQHLNWNLAIIYAGVAALISLIAFWLTAYKKQNGFDLALISLFKNYGFALLIAQVFFRNWPNLNVYLTLYQLIVLIVGGLVFLFNRQFLRINNPPTKRKRRRQ